ncbi:MAG: 1-(5-phosphoribosyl)-5-[(5-phosphoribosylamino)methylideneamino]imidazole-4-carboxamide isomerase [Chloroflexota bacterium]
MQLIPAIDIRAGRCVRLWQGDYAQETVYAEDPVAVALAFAQAGAQRLHVVDLDGAAGQSGRNLSTVRAIAAAVAVPVQLGGGLRSWEALAEALAAGIDRVVLGTAALRDEALLARAVAEFGTRVAVGIDARGGLVAVHGWQETAAVSALEFARRVVALGVARLIYTDIARDGTLAGPNLAAMAEMAAAVSVPVVASGGVASVDDLRHLAGVGVEAAIVGRALYTGQVDLSAALQSLTQEGAVGAD